MIYKTHSEEETQQIAFTLAKEYINQGVIIALYGDLGAGKTSFSKGFARGLGIVEKVISPTFVLMRQYLIPETQKQFYHLDLYRLEDNIDPLKSGLDEIFQNADNLVLIEWAEKIESSLPRNVLKIKIISVK